MKLRVYVSGVGLLGPGLSGWAQGAPRLRAGWVAEPTLVPAPQRLPATERRRAGTVVKASIVVADEAVAAAALVAADLPTVFTSSTGDPTNCHLLCEALAQPERLVSPTRFTNSVHNAAAGYWHIALQSRAPSTSLAAHDASFAAGVLEAATQCVALQQPVLLVACDVPYPEPLHRLRPVQDVFAVAMVLSPVAGKGGPVLALETRAANGSQPLTACGEVALETLRLGIPAARSLPLLQALAQWQAGTAAASTVVLEDLPGLALHLQLGGAAA